jgi:hypothetical protein
VQNRSVPSSLAIAALRTLESPNRSTKHWQPVATSLLSLDRCLYAHPSNIDGI